MMLEPIEYTTGRLSFRGLEFKIDRRAYVTDPETSFLVDHVAYKSKLLTHSLGRPAVLVEVGLGCASLALALKVELKSAVHIIGLEIDPPALDLARENIAAFGVEVEAIKSDLFSAMPPGLVPDLVYADPPWGDHASLYDDERGYEYYKSMPTLSAFPCDGKVGFHQKILKSLIERGWGVHLLLNLGVLTETDIAPLFQLVPNATLIRGKSGQCLFACQV